MGWAKSSETDEEKNKKELAEQVAEIAVEREMQKETEDEARQEEDRKLIEAAMAKSVASPALTEASGVGRQRIPVRRIVLRDPGRGKVVATKVFGELGLLCVLRDEG
jgi:alkylation response protein AidB-like acyl-CoA dehydrogenase